MRYSHMSKDDIKHSSRRFLYEVYRQYPRSVCENLGISADEEDDEREMSDEEYPAEMQNQKVYSKEERQAFIEEEGELLSQFSGMNF